MVDTTNSVRNNAPEDLNVTYCYVSNDGDATKTSLGAIKTALDTATVQVTKLEKKIGEGEQALTKGNINTASGVVGTTSMNDVVLPVNFQTKTTSWLRGGKDIDGNLIPSFVSTGCEYWVKGVSRPYQIIYKASPDGKSVIGQVWATALRPANVNDTDLGSPAFPFNNLYVSNAPSVVSDANSKTVLTNDISKSEYAKLLNAVFSVSTSLYKQKLVEKQKGTDEARIHAGFIAQELEKAVLDEGLDPSLFAFWIKSPVYEETQHEIINEDGSKTTTSTYALKVDADGDQVYQQSLRYEELSVLLIEALKYKVSNLDSRLSALEGK